MPVNQERKKKNKQFRHSKQFVSSVPCSPSESKPWYKSLWLHIIGNRFYSCHDSVFSSKCRNSSKVNLPYQNKMSNHLLSWLLTALNGLTAQKSSWRRKGLLLPVVCLPNNTSTDLLQFSIDIYHCLLTTKVMYIDQIFLKLLPFSAAGNLVRNLSL